MSAIKNFISKEVLNPEIISDLERIEEEEIADRKKMVYKGYNKTYDFRKFKRIRAFGDDIRTNFINMYTSNDEKNYLAKYIKEFKGKTRPAYNSNSRKVKEDVLNSAMALLKGREIVYEAFES